MAEPVRQTLTPDDISKLFDELQEDGLVTRDNVELHLHTVALDSSAHPHLHLQLPNKDGADLTNFVNTLFPEGCTELDREEFTDVATAWDIPSQAQSQASNNSSGDQDLQLTRFERLRSLVALEAPRLLFLALVIALQFAFAIWQFVKYMNNQDVRHALGWGVIVAKTATGPIYPTIFFMILSMSRWLATWSRKFPGLRQIVNWDLYRGFHIYMCCCCLFFGTVHGLGHLCGDFVWGSRPSHQLAVQHLFGKAWYGASYQRYLDILPGWTGILAIIIFWIIFGLSVPSIRNHYFEIFQLGHLLMFPFIALLMAHGTLALLQAPMLGYWLIIPTILVVCERVHRVIRGFIYLPSRADVLDKDTITLTIKRRWGRPWRYAAGQYVLLQVPSLSRWQWHPFTISSCNADRITLHIRTDGNWTKQLRELVNDTWFVTCVDGPYGAPAQQIYHFDRAIVVGSGIGVTPMSSIASNYAIQMQKNKDPWRKLQRSRGQSPFAKVYTPFASAKHSPASSIGSSRCQSPTSMGKKDFRNGFEIDLQDMEKGNSSTSSMSDLEETHNRRRIDFHWITRDPQSLKWFSDHLNRAQKAAEGSNQAYPSSSSISSLPLRFGSQISQPAAPARVDLNINTYITAPAKSITTHVLRHLLDRYRSPVQSYSALTGLKNDSIFGKPSFAKVMQHFHKDMRKQGWVGGEVGVFFCGNPSLGATLKEACRRQSERARADGSRIRYLFIGEVF